MTKQKVKFKKHYWIAVDEKNKPIFGWFYETRSVTKKHFIMLGYYDCKIIKVQIKEVE